MTLAALIPTIAAAAGAPAPSPGEIGTPVFLNCGAGVHLLASPETSATAVSASVSPAADARVVVAFYGRGNNRTHDSVTAGFATVAGFAKIEDVQIEEPAATFHRLSLWEATTTGTPGSGTITGTASGTHFGYGLGAATVTDVGSKVIDTSAANATGTSVAITLTGATTDDVMLLFGVARSAAAGLTFGTGQTQAGNSPLVITTAFTMGAAHKTSAAAAQTMSGLPSDEAHLLAGIVYRGAA